jgi:hypothetical protein
MKKFSLQDYNSHEHDLEIEVVSISPDNIMLECEVMYEDDVKAKFYLDCDIDFEETGFEIDNAYDSEMNRLSFKDIMEITNNAKLMNNINEAIEEAVEKYEDYEDEDEEDYEECGEVEEVEEEMDESTKKAIKFIKLQRKANEQIDRYGEIDEETADELDELANSINSYEAELIMEMYETNFADGGSTDNSVAMEILRQLGGIGRLSAMTGAYNFLNLGDGVSFRIKNQRANYIKIKLNTNDLYDVQVGRIRGTTYKVVSEASDLYNDQLKPFIEKSTGMYLSL